MEDRFQMPMDTRTGMPSLKGPFQGKNAAAAIDRLVDSLTASVTAAIEIRVREQAPPLFRKGYRSSELIIDGYGRGITVNPVHSLHIGRMQLLGRRMLYFLHLKKRPVNKLQDIFISDWETRQIVGKFHLLREQDPLENA